MRKFLIVSMLLLAAPKVGLAARLFLEKDVTAVRPEQQFEVRLLLNTDSARINATEGTLYYPEDMFQIMSVREGKSIISFWTERPEVPREQGKISWSGAIVNGFSGSAGQLFSVVFKAKKEATATLKVQNAKTLLHDGKGTAVKLILVPMVIAVSKDAPVRGLPDIQDNTSPEPFTPILVKEPNLFDRKLALVFTTSDTGVGLSHYEVQEVRPLFFFFRKKPRADKWLKAESPYLLKDQKGKSIIYLRAVDKNGNTRMATLKRGKK